MKEEVINSYNKLLLFFEIFWIVIFGIDILDSAEILPFRDFLKFFIISSFSLYAISSIVTPIKMYFDYRNEDRNALYYSSQLFYFSIIKPIFYFIILFIYLRFSNWNYLFGFLVVLYVFIAKFSAKYFFYKLDDKYRDNPIAEKMNEKGGSLLDLFKNVSKYIIVILIALLLPYYFSSREGFIGNKYIYLILFTLIPSAFLMFCNIKKYSPAVYLREKFSVSDVDFTYLFYTCIMAFFYFRAIPSLCILFLIVYRMDKYIGELKLDREFSETIAKTCRNDLYILEALIIILLNLSIFSTSRIFIYGFLKFYLLMVIALPLLFYYRYKKYGWQFKNSLNLLLYLFIMTLLYLSIAPFMFLYSIAAGKIFAIIIVWLVFVIKEWNKYILNRSQNLSA